MCFNVPMSCLCSMAVLDFEELLSQKVEAEKPKLCTIDLFTLLIPLLSSAP